MMLRVRKIITCSSNNEWYALFEEGELNKPICLLYEHEAEQLLADLTSEMKPTER